MEYKIVYGETMELLEAAVKAHIADGWLPQGGIAIYGGVLYQAITKI